MLEPGDQPAFLISAYEQRQRGSGLELVQRSGDLVGRFDIAPEKYDPTNLEIIHQGFRMG